MQSSPSTVYSQSIDKQRIVVVGQSSSRITEIILFVLNHAKRKFDYSASGKEKFSEAPMIIIEPEKGSNTFSEYNHHILVISELSQEQKPVVSRLANATPKSGTIIYDDTNPAAREIAKVERADVFLNPYATAKYEVSSGKLTLISGNNEMFSTQLSSVDDLKNISAAKELLKKVGVSSAQFYKAIALFQ
jgi:UDP-N-acetylmuramate: L-alanyl-gamma-D-glutamyl-meso-diaminopimelate ligase